MSFRPGSYTAHANYQLLVERFRGVDSTDPAFQVANNRGVYANNYALIGNCVQTRWAKEQTAHFDYGAIRGLWSFGNGYVAIIGNKVLSLSKLASGASVAILDSTSLTATSGSVYGVSTGDSLWILTGEKFLRVKGGACQVVAESDFAYAPTTMTSIVATDCSVVGSGFRYEIAKPNMLSRWRKNKLLTGVARSGNGMPRFVLDGKLTIKGVSDNTKINAKIDFIPPSVSSNEDGKLAKLSLSVNEPTYMNFTGFTIKLMDGEEQIYRVYMASGKPIRSENIAGGENLQVWINFANDGGGNAIEKLSFNDFIAMGVDTSGGASMQSNKPFYSYANGVLKLGYGSNFTSTSNYSDVSVIEVSDDGSSSVSAHGYAHNGAIEDKDGNTLVSAGAKWLLVSDNFKASDLNNLSSSSEYDGIRVFNPLGGEIYGYIENAGDNSVLTLFRDYTAPIAGESNVEIKFPVYDSSLSAEIDKCRIGCRFGHNNSLNRLWVSGNPSLPNYAIHSAVAESEGDYSYFPLDGELRFGSASNAILGMDVIDTSKMLVLKGKKGNERTVYIVSPATVSIDGEETSSEGFTIGMSNSPIAINALGQTANFYGTSLFVSNEGKVCAVTSSGEIGNTARQAVSVSHFIDAELASQDMSEARLFAFANYLILNAGDRAYVSNHDSLSSDSSQFEWWPIDKFDGASCFFEDDDGTPYYGTSEGDVFKLTLGSQYREDSFKRFYKAEGADSDQIVGVGANGSISCSGSWSIEGNRFVPYDECECLAKLGEFDEEYSCETATDGTRYIVFASVPKAPIHDGMKLYTETDKSKWVVVKEVADATFKYEVTDNQTVGILNLYSALQGEYSISGGKLFQNGKEVALTQGHLHGEYERRVPIVPEFVTKPLLCETLNYSKTILQAELWNDSRLPSELHARMVGNKVWSMEADKAVQDSREQFSFDSASFEDCGFDKKVVPTHYSLRRFPKSQAFFTIMLKGNSKRVSVLSGVKLTYQKRGLAKGRG